MRLYVGNLPYQAADEDLRSLFTQAGATVDKVDVVRDRFSGESRGFAFVEIAGHEEGERAIRACNGMDLMGRKLVVNEARPPGPRTGGGGGGGGGGGRDRGDRGRGR